MEEGSAPGYPLGYGPYGSTYDIRLVKVVGSNDEGDEEDDSSSDGGLTDEDGKGVPLYGRESRIILGDN